MRYIRFTLQISLGLIVTSWSYLSNEASPCTSRVIPGLSARTFSASFFFAIILSVFESVRSVIIIETITLSPSRVSLESVEKISPQTTTFPLCISTSESFMGLCFMGLPIITVISEKSMGSPERSGSAPDAAFTVCGCAAARCFIGAKFVTGGCVCIFIAETSTSVTPEKTTSIVMPNSSRIIFCMILSQCSFSKISSPPWASSIFNLPSLK